MPNIEQVKSAIRWLIATFGPILIAHGYASQGTLEMVSGAAVSLAPLIWGLVTHAQANAITVVDTIAKQPDSPVKAIIMEPTQEGHDLANSIPGSTTVVAGTQAAAEVVK